MGTTPYDRQRLAGQPRAQREPTPRRGSAHQPRHVDDKAAAARAARAAAWHGSARPSPPACARPRPGRAPWRPRLAWRCRGVSLTSPRRRRRRAGSARSSRGRTRCPPAAAPAASRQRHRRQGHTGFATVRLGAHCEAAPQAAPPSRRSTPTRRQHRLAGASRAEAARKLHRGGAHAATTGTRREALRLVARASSRQSSAHTHSVRRKKRGR